VTAGAGFFDDFQGTNSNCAAREDTLEPDRTKPNWLDA
jgi:hypothetical protein